MYHAAGQVQLRKYLKSAALGIANFMVLGDLANAAALDRISQAVDADPLDKETFPDHPAGVHALQEWWPLNPYTGRPMEVFTPQDGAMDEVFSGEEAYGRLYWERTEREDEDGGTFIEGRLSVFMPSWDLDRDREYLFCVDRSRWQMIGLNRGMAYTIVVTSQTREQVGLREMKPQE